MHVCMGENVRMCGVVACWGVVCKHHRDVRIPGEGLLSPKSYVDVPAKP